MILYIGIVEGGLDLPESILTIWKINVGWCSNFVEHFHRLYPDLREGMIIGGLATKLSVGPEYTNRLPELTDVDLLLNPISSFLLRMLRFIMFQLSIRKSTPKIQVFYIIRI